MPELEALIRKYRRGRDSFDALAIEAARLYASGELLTPLEPGVRNPPLSETQALEAVDLPSPRCELHGTTRCQRLITGAPKFCAQIPVRVQVSEASCGGRHERQAQLRQASRELGHAQFYPKCVTHPPYRGQTPQY